MAIATGQDRAIIAAGLERLNAGHVHREKRVTDGDRDYLTEALEGNPDPEHVEDAVWIAEEYLAPHPPRI